jgi:GMP synthase (glutamine-hydrolysing)
MRPRLDAVVWVADAEITTGLDYGVRLVERLAARGLRVAREDLTSPNGRVPAARLHVLSGGGTSVNDRSGWMRQGLRLVRQLVEAGERGEHAVLGVCLGSQMIAEVLWPGSVHTGERIEVGLVEVSWLSQQPPPTPVVVPAFHFEQVDRARAVKGGATVVAEARRGGLQGFQVGDRVWGVQFHPELTPADVRRLVAYHRQTIEAHDNSPEAALKSVANLEPGWDPALFDRIVDHVGADRR